MKQLWTVWVGGIEVNDTYLPFDKAYSLGWEYSRDGYTDVYITTIKDNKTTQVTFKTIGSN
jgi:hypothetical protein